MSWRTDVVPSGSKALIDAAVKEALADAAAAREKEALIEEARKQALADSIAAKGKQALLDTYKR